jgi:hypothetical protein
LKGLYQYFKQDHKKKINTLNKQEKKSVKVGRKWIKHHIN